MNSALESQKEHDADDELAQFSDDDEEEASTKGEEENAKKDDVGHSFDQVFKNYNPSISKIDLPQNFEDMSQNGLVQISVLSSSSVAKSATAKPPSLVGPPSTVRAAPSVTEKSAASSSREEPLR